MANLLSWVNNVNTALKKKRDEIGESTLLNRLQQSVQSARVTNSSPKTEMSYATTMSQISNPANQTFKTSTFNAGTKNYNPSATQTSSRSKTFSLNSMANQFNTKTQEPTQIQTQSQTEREQKQNNLLQSSMKGGSLLSNLANGLKNTNADELRQKIEAARVTNQNPKTEVAYSSTAPEYYKNDTMNLNRTVGTSLRDTTDTKTYGNIDVNDSNNLRYFGNQNLLSKTFKSILGNDADVSNTSYRSILDSYNNASGDAQADVKKAIADEITTQQKYAKQGNQESLKSLDYLNDLNSLLTKYGNDKGKSFGKQLGDWLSSGGIVGNIGGNALTQTLGNMTGTADNVNERLQKLQNAREDLGMVGALDAAGTAIGNTALNLMTSGNWGLGTAGLGAANTLNRLGDKVVDYDENGNTYIRDKSLLERLGELGNSALDVGFAALGKAGKGPGLDARFTDLTTGLPTLTGKDVAKYIAKEIPWAAGTTYLQEGLSNLASGKDWGDMNVGDLARNFAANVGQDVGMDLFNYGRQRSTRKNARLAAQNMKVAGDGSIVKTNSDGTTQRISDAELAEIATDPTSRLADLGYETSQKVNQVSKKVAEQINKLPLGMTVENASGLKDRFGNDFTEQEVPVSKLVRSQEFQPRTTASGKATSDSVFKNGYNEGQVDQPMLVRKMDDGTYEVLGGHSRTEGLERRAAAGLKNPENVKARVYEGITDKQALQISQAANQGGQYESIIDMAKSISDARKAGIEPSVQKQNMVKGYTMDDYQSLNDILKGDSALQNYVFQGAISQEDMLSVARTARRLNFDPDRTRNLVRTAYERGNFNRKGVEAIMKQLSTKQAKSENSQSSMFDFLGEDFGKVLDSQDDILQAQKDARRQKTLDNSLERVRANIDSYNADQKQSLLDILMKLPEVNKTQALDGLVETGAGKPRTLTEILKNSAEDTEPTKAERLQQNVQALSKMLTGQSTMRPAYAEAENIPVTIKKSRDTTKTDNTKNFSTYKGADGKTAVKVDDPTLLENTPVKDYQSVIRKAIRDKFQGQSFRVGDTNSEATVSGNTAGKISRRGGVVGDDIAYRNKGEASQQLDELVNNLHNIRTEPNNKPTAKGRERISSVTKGEIEVDINGNKVYPTIVIRNYDDGTSVIHEISGIKRTAIGSIEPVGRNNFPMDGGSKSSNNPIVSQNEGNVKSGGNKKQSKFATETVQKSQEVSDELKNELKKGDTSYRTTSNAERLAKSEQFMKSHTLSEAESDIANRVINKKVGKISDQDVSDAIAVVKALDAKGDNASLERATAISNSLSQHMTKKGQEIQALSLLNNRTPEGLRYGAEKAIAKSGVEITPEIHKKVLADTERIVKSRNEVRKAQQAYDKVSQEATKLYNGDDRGKNITKSDYQRIMSELTATGNKLDSAKHELDVSYGNMSKTVADNTKQTVGNIYTSIHKAGLLSAPTTHARNLVSNSTFHAMNKTTDIGAAVLDRVVSLFTGKRTKTLTMRGEGEGFVKGARYGLETMKTGIDELNGSDGKYTSGFPELRFKNHKFADAVIGKPDRIIFRAMSAGDKPFRYQTQANSLYDQALATAKNMGLKGKGQEIFVKQFVTDPPQAALNKAIADGERAVLGQDNMAAKLINTAIKKLENSDSLGAKILGHALDAHVVPFVKVPTNFLVESANYTPVGAVKEVFKLVSDGIHGKGFDQRTFVESISKSAIGTAGLVALGKMLADNFTGEYPDDEAERNRWEAEGIKENAVKIGDRYYPLDTFGPAALLIGAGATFWKAMDEGDSMFDAAGEAMGQLTRNLEDQSFLSGVSNVMDVIEGKTSVGSSLSNYVKQEVASEIPNISKKLAAALDPYMRSTGKKSELPEQIINQVMNSIPGLRTLLPAKVDNYGNELKNGAFITGFLDPTNSGIELQNGNQIVEEVARLHNMASELDLTDEEKKELQITPSDVDYKFGAKGSQVDLTDDEQRELTKLTGQLISSTWQKTMDSDDYKNSDDLRKARLLTDAKSAAVNLAKQQFADEHGYTAPKMTNDAKALQNGTYTASAKSNDGSSARNNAVEISGNLDSTDPLARSTLEKYNSMTSDEWNEYINGSSAESARAEYALAYAKYMNDLAGDKLTDVEKIKREKEVWKLSVSQQWEKKYRDAYGLASNKEDMQTYLNRLDDNTRSETVDILNGLNEEMYKRGVISESTYKSRYRAINNIASSSSGISSAEASAWSSLAKTLANGDTGMEVKTPSAPTSSKSGASSGSGGGKTGLSTYSTKLAKSATVTKNAKRAIV